MKIGIIGRFIEGQNALDGQTIKTRILRDVLINKCGRENIFIVDVYNYIWRAIVILFEIFFMFSKCDILIVLLSKNGRNVLFPIIHFLNIFFKKKIYHDVIGGNLHNDIDSKPKLKEHLIKFESNWVETNGMKELLIQKGIDNVEVVPNFKNIVPLKKDELFFCDTPRFCTFSRVTKSKGIVDAIMSVTEYNSISNTCVFLDIYGQIDESFKKEFFELVNGSDYVEYKGEINYSDSVDVLKQYTALIFPTLHEGEGFPGTIIDAFFAGIPVIANNWKYNSEIVKDKYTGLIYDHNNKSLLLNAIKYAIDNPDLMREMKYNCLLEAEKYSYITIVDQIINIITNF